VEADDVIASDSCRKCKGAVGNIVPLH
jgi:hypothetical protein